MVRSRYVRHKYRIPWYFYDSCGLVALTGALVLVCSLLSHNPYDPSLFYVTSQPVMVTNWCGVFGAQLSAVLVYLFGCASLLGVICLMLIAYDCIVYKTYIKQVDRHIASVLMMFVGASWCTMVSLDWLGTVPAGGAVGLYLYHLIYAYFDALGTLLCIHCLLLICLFIMTRLSPFFVLYYVLKSMRLSFSRAMRATQYVLPRMYRIACYVWFLGDRFCDVVSAYAKHILVGVADYEDTYRSDAWLEQEGWDTSIAPAVQETIITENLQPNIQSVPRSTSSDTKQVCPESYRASYLAFFEHTPQENKDTQNMKESDAQQARLLEEKLACFGIKGSITSIKRGPVVTLFEYQPDIDAKISKIVALEHDLALALQAMSIRIIAPIPGKAVVGFEVANKHRKDVLFSHIITSSAYTEQKAALPLVLGQDTSGDAVVVDLASMPHLLVAGSTGSGKSVALNAMLVGLLCSHTPKTLKLILIDPKRLEFATYTDIPHLIFPIITDPKLVEQVLAWVVKEMEDRYALMALVGARNSIDYNKNITREPLSYIVVVIDELADVMMTAGRAIELQITRIAQMARAAGIHLIVATQRPSVDVITGLIKANFPSRISFRVASKIDSRTILDVGGADALVGRGDMLFLDSRTSHIKRVHGAYVSDEHIQQVVTHSKLQAPVMYKNLMEEMPARTTNDEPEDAIYQEIVYFLQTVDEVSISLLQRRFRIGYNRAARIIEMLEMQGRIMSCEQGKIRKVIK